MNDYKDRKYLASIEAAKYLNITVKNLHQLVENAEISCMVATSGQKRFDIGQLKNYENNNSKNHKFVEIAKDNTLEINDTTQRIFVKNAMSMDELKDSSVHLMITSPPYFNAKMYSNKPIENDLGNIHDLDEWLDKICLVWQEVFRVLQPGRKAFVNIMNLPVRENGGFRSLNLVGKTIDRMEKIGFIFKRDIVWQKTHGVKAHFGSYPYPGGILINNMHEFILEFEKPNGNSGRKYNHLNNQQKEESKIDKEFWLSIKNTDVWVMSPENSGDNRTHVAPFPYDLPYKIIKAWSFVGETILDPFLGSGTALKAAVDLKRNGVGYEIMPEIASNAIGRLQNYQGRLIL